MVHYPNKIRAQALNLRSSGFTFVEINKELKVLIPKGTLNYWFKNLAIPNKSKDILLNKKRKNLVKIRAKANRVLADKRKFEFKKLESLVQNDYNLVGLSTKQKELLLAMLYLGEGFKNRSQVGLGNSNPEILRMFIRLLEDVYKIDRNRLKCSLNLRMDQDCDVELNFWSKELKIKSVNFYKPQFDKRTAKSKTWVNYHGVCSILLNDALIDKRLKIVQNILAKKILGD
jgi:hypothetical protein